MHKKEHDILVLVTGLEQLMQDYSALKRLELEILRHPKILTIAEFNQIFTNKVLPISNVQELCALLVKYDPTFAEHRYKSPMLQLSLNVHNLCNNLQVDPLLADELAYAPFMLHSIYNVLCICMHQLKWEERKLAALISQEDANPVTLYVVTDIGLEVQLRSLVGSPNPYVGSLKRLGVYLKKEYFAPGSYILTESNELYYVVTPNNIRLIVDRGLDAMRPSVASRAGLCLTDNDPATIKLRATKKINLTASELYKLKYQISKDPKGRAWLAESHNVYRMVMQINTKIAKFITAQKKMNRDINAVKSAKVDSVPVVEEIPDVVVASDISAVAPVVLPKALNVTLAQDVCIPAAASAMDLRKILGFVATGSRANKEQVHQGCSGAYLFYNSKPIFSKHKVNKKLKYCR